LTKFRWKLAHSELHIIWVSFFITVAMPSSGPTNETPIIVRVPSNVVNAATADAVPEDKGDEEKVQSETESSDNAQPEFKEGGYGW
jgi:hypothetical protein